MTDNKKVDIDAAKPKEQEKKILDPRAGAIRSKQVIRKGGVTILDAPEKVPAEEKNNS